MMTNPFFLLSSQLLDVGKLAVLLAPMKILLLSNVHAIAIRSGEGMPQVE